MGPKISVPAPKRNALFPATEYLAMEGLATWLSIFLKYDESKDEEPVDLIFTIVEPIGGAIMSKENCPIVLPSLSFTE